MTRTIRLVVDKLAQEDPGLAHFIRSTIHTGTLCCYAPDPAREIEWEFESDFLLKVFSNESTSQRVDLRKGYDGLYGLVRKSRDREHRDRPRERPDRAT